MQIDRDQDIKKLGAAAARIAGLKVIDSRDATDTLETKAVWSSMENVVVVATEWLWEDRIPMALTVFLGDPDMGKSLVTLEVAAIVSAGRDFPDAKNKPPPSKVLLMIAEDSVSSTVKPRLIAANANLSNIEYLERVEIRLGAKKEEREFALDEDLKHLADKLTASPDVRVVICDTISSYLVKTEMGKEQPMRKVLLPVANLCEKHRIAFIGVAHFNKRSDVSMIHKASGAVALVGVPRAAWVFGANKEIPGDYYMLRIKNNLSKVRTGLSYTIAERKIARDIHGKDIVAPYIVWREQPVSGEANDLLATEGADERKQAQATKFLLEFLSRGARLATEVHQEAAKRGIGRNSIFDAKKAAGVCDYKAGKTWWWSLEPKPNSTG
jgi:RecA-family ATPase